MSKTTTTTCAEAQALSKNRGVKVFWRPGGKFDWKRPDGDAAEVTEG